MEPQTIRRAVLALFAVFSAWLMPWVASAGVTITPAAPTINDSVQLEVTWDVPDPCHNGTYTYSVAANLIRIELTTVNTAPGSPCAQVITSRTVTVPVGVLSAGQYAVEVYNRLGTTSAFQLLFNASFDVTAADVVVVPLEGQVVSLFVKPLPPSNYAVQLRTSWIMPSSCYAASGTTSVTGNSIRADVTVVATGGICAAVLSPFDYRSSSLGKLPPGTYHVATYFNGVPGNSRDLTVMPDVTPANPALTVTPAVPNRADDVSIVVTATLPSSCYEAANYQTVAGNEIRLDLSLVGTHAGCVGQPISQEARYFLGKMTPGTYTVRMYYNGVLGLTSDLIIKPVADMAISQTVTPNPVKLNRVVLQSAEVTNPGPDAVSGVVVRSTLPGNFSVVNALVSQGRCELISVIGRREIACTIGTMNAGATVKVGILSRARVAGTAVLGVSLDSDAVDPNISNNDARTSIRIRN